MLQREIMALVSTGNPGEPAAVVTASEDIAKAQEHAVAAEKRVAELEAQLALGDVGTRKRLREAEQRICELEFRLAQVDEAPAPAPVAPVAPAEIPVATRIPGKPGFVKSPFDTNGQPIDVRDFQSGQKAKCPYTGKVFRVP
jgi:uncharacterized coiled-coil protein SlyX